MIMMGQINSGEGLIPFIGPEPNGKTDDAKKGQDQCIEAYLGQAGTLNEYTAQWNQPSW